jgi:GNAT superfamily N-acetyltransferase
MKQTPTISLRQLLAEDINVLASTFCFPWSSIEATTEKWKRYYEEQQKDVRIVCILEKQCQLIGYGTLLRFSEYPYFKTNNIPEINDVWIASQERKKGLGTLLITYLEKLAKEEGFEQVGIGVGLYADYGQAQRLYFKLGYAPDGTGITYNYLPIIPGEKYPIDDDLILWLTKSLT